MARVLELSFALALVEREIRERNEQFVLELPPGESAPDQVVSNLDGKAVENDGVLR